MKQLMRKWGWAAFVVVGVAAVISFLIWEEGLLGTVIYDGLAVLTALAIFLAARFHRPDHARSWYLIAAGIGMFAVGDLIYAYYEFVLEQWSPWPSWADAAYLSGYAFLIAGVYGFVKVRSGGEDRTGLLDSLIVTTGLGALLWVVTIAPYMRDPSLTFLERAVSMAYPLADLAALAVAARLVISTGRKSTSYAFLGMSFGLLFVADVLYGIQTLSGTYEGGFTTDGFWMLSYVFAGAAALHPSMKLLTSRADDHRTRSARFRLVMLTGAFLCVPAVMGGQAILDDHIDVGVVVTASVFLIVLISMRMWGLITEIEGKVDLLQAQEGTLRAALSERDQLTEQLKYMAFHDSLTGVANRELFLSRMTVALAGRRKKESGTVVLFVDIDDFKDINDNYGHMAGDALLRTVSSRLQMCVRGGDTVSRMGGDEFAMLLNDADEETASRVADRVLAAMAEPVQLGSREIGITVSMGIAVAHDDESSADEVLRRADVAMYQVKGSGKRSYAFWSGPGGMIPAL